MVSLIVVLAIVTSIILGYRTKINTGFFAMVFAYIIGCFMLDMRANQVIALWPIGIFYVIFAVSVFYNFALVNGTLEKVAMRLMYACRKAPHLLPYALFLAAAAVAAMGAGFFTVMAFFAPITLLICRKTGLNMIIGAVAVNAGCLAGANFVTSGSGVVFRSLIDAAKMPEVSFAYTNMIFAFSIFCGLLFIFALSTFYDKNKLSSENFEVSVPEPFDSNQKITLTLMLLMLVVVLAPPILKSIFPANKLIGFVNSKLDIGLVAITFSVIAFMLKLGDEKKILANVPWNLLIMICGVGMLIGVAIKAGTIKILAGWIGTSIPVALVPIVLALVGAMMSSFSSTLGVVAPALFPIVPAIAMDTGINPAVLFACVIIGAQSSAISPFSSGGSLILGSCTSDEERQNMFSRLLLRALPFSVIFATIFCAILGLVM